MAVSIFRLIEGFVPGNNTERSSDFRTNFYNTELEVIKKEDNIKEEKIEMGEELQTEELKVNLDSCSEYHGINKNNDENEVLPNIQQNVSYGTDECSDIFVPRGVLYSTKNEQFNKIANQISANNKKVLYTFNDHGTDQPSQNFEEFNTAPNENFSNKFSPALHIRDINKKPYRCIQCDRTFSRIQYLKRHVGSHAEKYYKCLTCNKVLNTASNLNYHKRKHSGEKPFQCPICQRGFVERSTLKAHSRIHTGEKPYKCFECHKEFSQRTNLIKHIRIHTGEKPFPCSECSKTFSQQSNLNIHLKSHERRKAKAALKNRLINR